MTYTKSDTSSKPTNSQSSWLNYLLIYKNTHLTITETKAKIILHVRDFDRVKYSVPNDNESLFISRYQLYLPTEKELRRSLEEFLSLVDGGR
jgi:hypothetical protein